AIRRDDRWHTACWFVACIACGVGCLAKGPISLLLIAGPGLVALLPPKNKTELVSIAAGLLIFLVIAAPWYVAVACFIPDLAAEFFWKHNIQRFTTAFDHVQPAWYYI